MSEQNHSGRQFVKYNFYKVDPQWRRLPDGEKQRGKAEFGAVVAEFSSRLTVNSYSLVGLRADADFMLWLISPTLEHLQEMAAQLSRTGLGQYLTTSYAYLAMTRKSDYVKGHRHPGQEGTRETIKPLGSKYLFVYPFVKTHQWYQLPMEERQKMMNEHFVLGHKYPSVKINTTYSFGIDDQDFVVGFETDSPSDFLELVMEMRSSQARPYTVRDTPIFTCVKRPLEECLEALG